MGLLKRMFGVGTKEPEKPVPLAMPPFPTTYDEVIRTLAPYYHGERPMDFFFEMFVVQTIGELPEQTLGALEEFSMKHATFFEAYGGNWAKAVVGSMSLSDTIEVAIQDLWLRNAESARQRGWSYHPRHYAGNFIEEYSKDGSKVDVWTEESLAQARQRIAAWKK